MKKIGEIKGVPVVEGNVNEVTKNQIHYKEEEGGIQLSKRNNDNKLNSITSGSSEGGGVKEYYYKIIYENIREAYSYLIILGKKFDILIYDKNNIIHEVDAVNLLVEPSLNGLLPYIKMTDVPSNLVAGYSDQGYVTDIAKYMGKGSIWETIDNISDDISKEELKKAFQMAIQDITKEEYESMITYKPE